MPDQGAKISALGWSLLVHAAIAASLVVTFRFAAPVASQPPAGKVIQAEAISGAALEQRAEAARRAEEARQAELRRQREAREARERAAAQREAERRQREEAARQEAARRAAEERARQQAAAEEARRKAAEEAARRKAEEEAARRAAEEARRRAAEQAARETREAEMQRSLEAEAQRITAIRSGKLAEYRALIIDKVMRNWLPPLNLPEDYYCAVSIRQIPGGEVVAVTTGKCDNEILARSAEAAVWKASPLPPPPDPAVFDQYVTVEFIPPED